MHHQHLIPSSFSLDLSSLFRRISSSFFYEVRRCSLLLHTHSTASPILLLRVLRALQGSWRENSKEKLESSSESCPGSISVNGLGFRVWCRRRLRTKDAESKATQLFWNKRSKLLTTKDLNFNFCDFLGKIETELSVAQRRRVGFRWVDGMVLLLPRMIDRLPGVWQHQSWRYLAAKAMKSASNS